MQQAESGAFRRQHAALPSIAERGTIRIGLAIDLAQLTWPIATLGAGLSMAGYLLLLRYARALKTAEPSYIGEIFSFIPVLTRETLPRLDRASLYFLVILGVLFASYFLVQWAVAGRRSGRLKLGIFAAGALFLVTQLFQPVLLSTDSYAYIMYGRLLAVYGADPYLPAQGDYWSDPFYWLTYGLPWPSWYGPIWTLVSAGLALLVDQKIGVAVLLTRGLAIVSALVAAGLIWASLRRLAPDRAAQGLVLFLWNPLLILETGLSAHNDAFMAALLLLGVWFHLRGHRLLPIVALSLSALVKLATVVLLPLYLVFVLRQLPDWRERCRYLALSGVLVLVTASMLFGVVRTGPNLPVVRSATAAYFYDNNLYQLVFPAVRIWLGEALETATTPVHFYPWWATAERRVGLLRGPDTEARTLERVNGGTLLLVTSPHEKPWVRVYNPESGGYGYVPENMLAKANRPDRANVDPVLGMLERNPASWPTALWANDLLRSFTWLAFAIIWVLAAWQATTLPRFLVAATVILLATYWLVATEIWPWYVIWSLALAALVPISRPAALAMLLSATVLSLYVTIGYERSNQSWIFTYRSLPAFVLPLLLFPLVLWVRDRMAKVQGPGLRGFAGPAGHDDSDVV